MSTITLAQLQSMTDDELVSIKPKMVNEAERLGALRLLLNRLDSAIYDLDRTREEVDDLKSYLDRERANNTRLEEEIGALRGRNNQTRRSTGEREMNTERSLELKDLQTYAARLAMLSTAEILPKQVRESIKQELAEVRRKIDLILNEGDWEI